MKQRMKESYGKGIANRPDLEFCVGCREEAERFLRELRERLAQFGLELYPEKTRLIEFGRNAARNRESRGEGKPETFDFLGFTHMCGKNGKTGYFVVNRKTVKKRMRAKLQALKEELRKRMHEPIVETGKWLKTVVRGYFQYHAIPGNTGSLGRFRERLTRLWWQNIRRRSQQRQPTGSNYTLYSYVGCQFPESFILFQMCGLTPCIRGRSRMR
jgi:RNA-directed DNA polymerase